MPTYFINRYTEQNENLQKMVDWLKSYNSSENPEISLNTDFTETEISEWTTREGYRNASYGPLFSGISTLFTVEDNFGAVGGNIKEEYFGGAVILKLDERNYVGFYLAVGQGCELTGYWWYCRDLSVIDSWHDLWQYAKVYMKDEMISLAEDHIKKNTECIARIKSTEQYVTEEFLKKFNAEIETEMQKLGRHRETIYGMFTALIEELKTHTNIKIGPWTIDDNNLMVELTDSDYPQYDKITLGFMQIPSLDTYAFWGNTNKGKLDFAFNPAIREKYNSWYEYYKAKLEGSHE